MPTIIICPHCGKDTYKELPVCPHCGKKFDFSHPSGPSQVKHNEPGPEIDPDDIEASSVRLYIQFLLSSQESQPSLREGNLNDDLPSAVACVYLIRCAMRLLGWKLEQLNANQRRAVMLSAIAASDHLSLCTGDDLERTVMTSLFWLSVDCDPSTGLDQLDNLGVEDFSDELDAYEEFATKQNDTTLALIKEPVEEWTKTGEEYSIEKFAASINYVHNKTIL